MADPVVTALTADTWTKVATNVLSGNVWVLSTTPNVYLHTYRMTGGAAPTTKTEAVPFPTNGMLPISAGAGIDVYVMAVNAAGSVRVDV